ncbi:MAG: hypothetical protein GXP26_00295 [Planctomycetes bacterium]|nr:hypothetical protein [Planctomycetota bacterium]
MVYKFFLLAVAALAAATFSGCQTPYGGGGCSNGSCAAPTATYVPYQPQTGGYVPSTPTAGGGSGSR